MKKFKKKTESPFADGSRLEKPNNPQEALTMLAYREQHIERLGAIRARLANEEVDLYIDACNAYIDSDFARLEAVKRAYAKNRAEHVSNLDEYAHVLMEASICKAYLAEHKPEADENGEVRYKQGRLF